MEATQTAARTRKFSITSSSFLVGILLFLLPFVEIKCNDQTFASNTGIGLAFGTDYETTSQMKSFENPFGNTSEKTVTEKQEGKMYVSALIALILGVIGLILSFMSPGPNKALVFIGSLAAICLIILMMQIRMDIKERSLTGKEDNLGNDLKITATFTAWYYLSILSFIIGAFLNYRSKTVAVSE